MTDGHRTAAGPRGPVVVVGGGVIGLCLAHYLAEGGAEVDVVERHHVGAGGILGQRRMGVRVTLGADPRARRRARRVGLPRPAGLTAVPATVRRPLVRTLDVAVLAQHLTAAVRCGIPRGRRAEPGHVRAVRRARGRWGRHHAPAGRDGPRVPVASSRRVVRDARSCRWPTGRFDMGGDIVEGDAAAALDPALSDGVRAAYLVPGEGVVDPERLTAALSKTVRERGVRIHEQTMVSGFRTQSRPGGAVSRRRTGVLDCSAVAVTAGTWSGMLRASARNADTDPGGQGLQLRRRPRPRRRRTPSTSATARSRSRPLDGTTRIAGTMELSGNNRRLDWRRDRRRRRRPAPATSGRGSTTPTT